jgi:Restriction endonuclease
MINLKAQRELALKILRRDKFKFNLYIEFDEFIKTPEDLLDIGSFLEPYTIKHNINFFYLDQNDGMFTINNTMLPKLLKMFLRYSPTKFEKLSALLLSCFNYNNYFITKRTHDQGIDLIAYSDHFKIFFNINSTYRHYIFGQCKKYKNKYVDTPDIQKLWGSMEMFKSKTFALKNPEKIYSEFTLKKYTPIHLIFSSGYFFSESALTLCENSDIITLDVLDITIIILKNLQKLNLLKKDGTLNQSRMNFIVNNVNVAK